MYFMTTSQKVYELKTNATGLNTAKNWQNYDRNGKIFQWCWYSKTIWKSSKIFWRRFNQNSLKSMQNEKSPVNDGLTKESYETFWNELKETFINSESEAKEIGDLSTSQRQAIIKLIEKKIEIRDLFKTRDPFLPDLISSQQTTYVTLLIMEHFMLGRGASKGDPISTVLFISSYKIKISD